MAIESKRVANGTFGTLTLDSEEVSETFGLQAKINFKYEDVPRCGELATDKKMIAWDGTGSIKMYKVNTRMGQKISKMLEENKEVRFTIISDLDDPDAFGAERVAIKNVLFNDLTLADWQAAKKGEIEAPFTFSSYKYLDTITPQD